MTCGSVVQVVVFVCLLQLLVVDQVWCDERVVVTHAQQRQDTLSIDNQQSDRNFEYDSLPRTRFKRYDLFSYQRRQRQSYPLSRNATILTISFKSDATRRSDRRSSQSNNGDHQPAASYVSTAAVMPPRSRASTRAIGGDTTLDNALNVDEVSNRIVFNETKSSDDFYRNSGSIDSAIKSSAKYSDSTKSNGPIFRDNINNVSDSNNTTMQTPDIGTDDFIVETVEQMCSKQGFLLETHQITTEDGYILRMHRIPYPRKIRQKRKHKGFRPSILIHHGILASSDTWVLRSAEEDLAFLLADNGYDVWLANYRGNHHSRRHVKMSPDDPAFWQFGFHEIAVYDLPAEIDYILNTTKQKDLFFLGHSMGTTIAYVLLSERPEYNSKIRLIVSYAPVVFFVHKRGLLQNVFVDNAEYIRDQLVSQGMYEVLPYSRVAARLGRALCRDGAPLQPICLSSIFVIIGVDYPQLNATLLERVFSHYPTGTTIQTIMHYIQNVRATGKFRKYDYGPEENMKRYNQTEPPEYDLSKVTAPVSLHYGVNDLMTYKEDIEMLAEHLPNVVGMFEVPYQLFNHLDFLWATDARTLLYEPTINLMDKYR